MGTVPLTTTPVRLTDGFILHHTIIGRSGLPKLVLLHGLSASPRLYLPLLQEMASAGYQIWVPDMPCHDRSSTARDWNDMVGRIAEWMDRLGLANVPVIGHSMGGLVGVFLAYSRPDLVSCLRTFGSPLGEESDLGRHDLVLTARTLWHLSVDTVDAVAGAALRLRRHPIHCARFVWNVEVLSVRNFVHAGSLIKALRVIRKAPETLAILDELKASGFDLRCVSGDHDPIPALLDAVIVKKSGHSFIIKEAVRSAALILSLLPQDATSPGVLVPA